MLIHSLVIGTLLLCTHASISDYISKSDIEKFIPAFKSAFENLNKDDLSNVYYGAKGFSLISQPLPINAADACKHLQKFFKDDLSNEIVFHSLASWSLLNCNKLLNVKLHKDSTLKALKATLDKQDSSIGDIRFALESLNILSEAVPNPTKIVQLLQAQLKEDDSLPSVGQALHAASLLGGAGQFAIQYVEDIVVQADEVDGRIMQWEGGLTLTSLLLTGLLRLPEAKPVTQTQAEKFATYLLTRKTVQNVKGVVSLLEAAAALSKSSVSPVSITFVDSAHVTTTKPDLKVRISNIFGQPLSPAPSPILAQSATRTTDDVVVLSKQPLTAGPTPTEYILPLKLDPGHYRVGLTAGSHSAALNVRVLGPVTVQWLEVGLSDSDGTSAPRLTKLQHPSKLTTNLQADSSHHLILRFSLSRPVQQPFLRLSSGKREIIFVAELDSSKAYKIDVNLANELSFSAKFELELILGDSIMSNPLRWSFGAIDVALSTVEPSPQSKRGPRPEIVHMFRPAEKRPPQTVSMLFTALAASPLLLLLILWIKVGINFKNFSFAALPFHVGLGGIFSLFTCFWLKLDMFATCAWLIPIGGFTFLAGHHILSKLAKQKK
ncbi:hypothetical protein PPYR_08663 [Photinus pyralis]|uniref:Dolichyl-diphosphooligosaccharide--protein glycosyltransferase subunit 2 n=1 Tax=Photinus pyralis TaxID=7054 RepID=A0A1Y1LAD2_PHOPY|nr:dolichyl-diphosphooligosaccharide--protein glycosyltransferase subunit 2 [Photinus pyralis]KAB0797670.1 hypothetical protein PPYR_08663 [Photinus pyralis]